MKRIKFPYLKIFLLVVLSLNFVNSFAQRWNVRRYEFHVGLGASNFMGDICAPKDNSKLIWVNFFNTIGYVADAHLKYSFTPRNSIGAGIYIGTLSARDPKNSSKYWYHKEGFQFRSVMTEISVRYEFLFWKEKRRSTVYRRLGETRLKNLTLPSYVFIGVGGLINYGKLFYNTDDGRVRKSDPYLNLAPVLPVGIGTKMRLDYNLYLNLEAGWRFTLSDGIDNAKGTKNPRNGFGTWYDQYQFVTVNLVYKLRAKRNKMPNFKF
jgi:hypothetical protein